MKNHHFFAGITLTIGFTSAQGALLVDFNSTNQGGGPNNDAAFQAYNAAHEQTATFTTQMFPTTFAMVGGGGGAATVDVTPSFPNTTDNRVQQMIDRGVGNDNNWNGGGAAASGPNLDLVTDWLGVDTRTANGGNGNYNGGAGTATLLDISLGSLPAGAYEWTSFHHDTENVFTDFDIEVSTDGGANFAGLGTFYMSDSTAGGNPNSATVAAGTYNGAGFTLDAATTTSPSTANFVFDADGTNDVVLRFTPDSGAYGNAVHNQLFGINGFTLERVPEPSRALLLCLGGLAFLTRRQRS